MTDDELREFLDTEIRRVVDEAKEKATDQALLAGMVVGTLMKSGMALAKSCGVSRSLVEHACNVFVTEVYEEGH